MSDLDQQIRDLLNRYVMGPLSTWPTLELADALRAVLVYATRLEAGTPAIAAGIRRTIATQLGLNAPETTPERASTGLTGDSEGSDTEDAPTPLCASCGRPRTPDYDADAPGPTVKHPFTLIRGRIQPDGEIHGSAAWRITIDANGIQTSWTGGADL